MNNDFYSLEVNEAVNSFLNPLSDDELRSIINDSTQESRLDELIEKCPFVPKLKQEKETLIAKNKSLADHNYNREPTYKELRKVLEDAHKQAVEQKQILIEKQSKLNKLKPKITPDTLRGLLQVAAQESEEQSEEIAKQFLSKEKTYEEFMKEFIKKRTEYHVRRLKYEKLIDSIQNPSLSANPNSFNSLNRISVNQRNTSSNNLHQANFPPTSIPTSMSPYPAVSNAPFAYQPFNNQSFNAVQPIRAAPLPPHMMELPPYQTPYPQTPHLPNSYLPQSNNLPSYPFNMNPMNPNFR